MWLEKIKPHPFNYGFPSRSLKDLCEIERAQADKSRRKICFDQVADTESEEWRSGGFRCAEVPVIEHYLTQVVEIHVQIENSQPARCAKNFLRLSNAKSNVSAFAKIPSSTAATAWGTATSGVV